MSAIESRLAKLLTRGTFIAVNLLVIGILLMLVRGLSPLDLPPTLDAPRIVTELVNELVTLHPAGYLWLGAVAVLSLPIARLAVAVVSFWSAGERSRAGVGLTTLAIIGAGVVIGLAAR